MVYSTNPEVLKNQATQSVLTSLAPANQNLKIQLSTRHRAGKTVTLIHNFIGNEQDLEALAKMLKVKCGTGGTAKDGEIILQGDFRQKTEKCLIEAGYKARII